MAEQSTRIQGKARRSRRCDGTISKAIGQDTGSAATSKPVIDMVVTGRAQRLVVEAGEAERLPDILFEIMEALQVGGQRRDALSTGCSKELLEAPVNQESDFVSDEHSRLSQPDWAPWRILDVCSALTANQSC